MSRGDSVVVGGTPVHGVGVAADARCAHHGSDRDVVALAFPCCEGFYPCRRCHDAVADHPARAWPDLDAAGRAALCGACGELLALATYFERLAGAASCPVCGAGFNPGCLAHRARYVEV